MSNRVLKLIPIKIPIKIVTKLMRSRVKMWGSKFGKGLWDSLTVATRRDTIQQVKMAIMMISRMMMLNLVIAMVKVMARIMMIMTVNFYSIESTPPV